MKRHKSAKDFFLPNLFHLGGEGATAMPLLSKSSSVIERIKRNKKCLCCDKV